MADEHSDEEVVFVPEEKAEARENQTEELEHLEEIRAQLEDLNEHTADTGQWFFRGVLQGAGAIVGSILMLILLGWLLGVLGVIPGFGEIANYIHGYVDQVRR